MYEKEKILYFDEIFAQTFYKSWRGKLNQEPHFFSKERERDVKRDESAI